MVVPSLAIRRVWAVRAGRSIGHFARRKPLGALGALIILVLIATSLAAPLVATHSYTEQSLADRLQGPSTAHLMGTDSLGRDVFSKIVYGSRVAVVVGFGAVLVATVVGGAVAVLSGFFGGWVDKGGQRLVDVWLAFPGLVLLITLMGLMGSGVLPLIVAIGLLQAAGASRFYRAGVLSIMHSPYIEAARSVGAGNVRIMLRHVLPNIVHLMIVSATLSLGTVILIESSLSFLGYGVPPPTPSWGQMLSGEGRDFFQRAPGLAIWPGLMITLTVYAFNVLGDALRDLLDPRLRGAR
ncbi:MAG: ABC transporter permease [Chloroflexi bacterium]|nr:ABC transporter permease [Chloroflexota bacterium]